MGGGIEGLARKVGLKGFTGGMIAGAGLLVVGVAVSAGVAGFFSDAVAQVRKLTGGGNS